MDQSRRACVDGNEAVALVAHRLSEVIAIYPITPASGMGELADAWSAEQRTNLWGTVPEVIEMQSEAGAAGVLHGAAQKGALATTFTASQGLLLMIPNLYKLAGELVPSVVHVAARTLATHALSIFCDHSDVMAARGTGMALLASASVQEAHDFALIAHASTLTSRVPFLHFFDGFRTSHEVATIELLNDSDLRAAIDEEAVFAHRARGLSPDHPVLRGSAQNPDVFFQAREAANPFTLAVPDIVARGFATLAARTGRNYGLVEYEGAPDAERVVVLMGSAIGAAQEAVAELTRRGEKVGLLKVRLFRPFPAKVLVEALPRSVRALAVLDRTKEPGSVGEPLYLDVLAAFAEYGPSSTMPRVLGGRYGLASKELTPAMIKAALDGLSHRKTPRHFTLGIIDDVTHTSLKADPTFSTDHAEGRALFFGIGSDGSVSATKSTAKILGSRAGAFAQGYFVYDSRKAGQLTISHLRFDQRPIHSTYLIDRAKHIVIGRLSILDRIDALAAAEHRALVLVNAPLEPAALWDALPREAQETVLARELRLFVVDADRIARDAELGERVGTVLHAAFFGLAKLMPEGEAIAALAKEAARAYGDKGGGVAERNRAAIATAICAARPVAHPNRVTTARQRTVPWVRGDEPDAAFKRRVTARLIAGEGDLLPVSALPADGTFPTGTSKLEKRMLADEIPIWDPSGCIDCGKCTIVCPHAAIRMKVFAGDVPSGLRAKVFKSRELPGHHLTIQVSPDDCTGCTLCVEACPARSTDHPERKTLTMEPVGPHRAAERSAWELFATVPSADLTSLELDTVKGAQARPPLFEFSGACSGCGETPYLKLLTQLFGDRLIVANATGCSSIFGGNLPTTPWAKDETTGRGPAWANSLFEDNAEFGLGMQLAIERQVDEAKRLLRELSSDLGSELVDALLSADQRSERGRKEQRGRIMALNARLTEAVARNPPTEMRLRAQRLSTLADALVDKSVWIVGGDGWAYDIGFGGLDHVLASGRNVNVLVLDTEVYSNTGGQASKATPRGALAKFAASGKPSAKKDLGRMALTYGGVFVAQVALGADDRHTIRTLLAADAWHGPSLVIAYASCIAHGYDMCASLAHQRAAAESGYWPLYHYDPSEGTTHDVHLDTRKHTGDIASFEASERRFGVTRHDLGDAHVHLLTLGAEDVETRWKTLADEAHADAQKKPR